MTPLAFPSEAATIGDLPDLPAQFGAMCSTGSLFRLRCLASQREGRRIVLGVASCCSRFLYLTIDLCFVMELLDVTIDCTVLII